MKLYSQSVAVLTAAFLGSSATSAQDVSTNLRRSDEKSEGQRKLQATTTFTQEGCMDSFLASDKLYRDDFSNQVHAWVDAELVADTSLNTQQLQALIEAGDTDHYPDFHKLPPKCREMYVTETCPYFFAEVAKRFDISKGTATLNLRFCLDPSAHKRCPAKLYLPIDKVKEYGKEEVIEKMCTEVGNAMEAIKRDLTFRYETDGVIVSTLRSQANALPHRFNKIKWDGAPKNIKAIDMTSSDYPISQAVYDLLRFSSAVSPVLPTDPNVIDTIGSLETISVEIMKGPPAQPEEERFWPLVHHMIKLQNYRRANSDGLSSEIFEVPALWKDHTIQDCADAVHNEYPAEIQRQYVEQQMKAGQLKIDSTIIPMLSGVDFINSVVLISRVLAWATDVIAATSFAMKWHVGRMRPEEVMLAIKEGRMDDIKSVVPDDIMKDIMDMDITTGPGFTAYNEGSPGHPSWPAMHSVGSVLSTFLPVITNLSEEQVHQTRLTDHAVAYCRSVAGVHYYDDNVAGLALGQALVQEALPEFLHNEYQSNIDAVRAKIAKTNFSWYEVTKTLYKGETAPGPIPEPPVRA